MIKVCQDITFPACFIRGLLWPLLKLGKAWAAMCGFIFLRERKGVVGCHEDEVRRSQKQKWAV